MGVNLIRPFMFQAHPAYRTQIEVLREVAGPAVLPIFPDDSVEHERWRAPASVFMRLLSRIGVNRELSVNGPATFGYISGSLPPERYGLLDRMTRTHIDADDPLSLFADGTRGRLPADMFRRWALSLCERLGPVSLSFWSRTQLTGFLANLRADESRDALASGMLSILPPTITPRVSRALPGHDGVLRCLTVASGKFWHKGVPEAAIAIDRLAAQGFPVRLTIIGADIPKDWMTWLSGRTCVDIFRHVTREDLDQLFSEHHALIFPSHHDTFGWVLLEAKSFGMPAVVTDAYNRAEIVTHGVDGLVLPDPFASPFLPTGSVPYAAAHLSIGSSGHVEIGPFLNEYIDALTATIRTLLEDNLLLTNLASGALASVQGGRYSGSVRRDLIRSRLCV